MEEQEKKKTITSSDKLPGCERLTRPEEIKGLSKYLGAIREAQEEWISENMPDGDGTLDPVVVVNEVNELPTKRIDINSDKISAIPTEIVKINPSEVVELPDAVVGLVDDKKTELPTQVDKLNVPEDKIIQNISKLKVDEKVSALPKEVAKINDDRAVKLPNGKIKIEDNRQIESLPDSVIGLDDSRNIDLPNSAIGLERVIDEIIELPEAVIGLEDNRDINLPNSKLNIYPTNPNSLPDQSERLPGKVEDPKLPDNTITRPGSEEDITLPAEKLKIYPIDPNSLPDRRLKVPGEEKELDLPNKVVNLKPAGKDVLSLPDLLSKPDVSTEDINAYVESVQTSELYTDIQKALTLGANGSIGHENKKLAGILSALYNNTEINAQEAAKILFDYFKSERDLMVAASDPVSYSERVANLKSGKAYNVEITSADLERYKTVERAGYKLPDWNHLRLNAADYDTYLRYLAELATYGTNGQGWWEGDNSGLSGWGRRRMLETTLFALFETRLFLERKLGIDRGALPNDQGDVDKKKEIISERLREITWDANGKPVYKKPKTDDLKLPGTKSTDIWSKIGNGVKAVGSLAEGLQRLESGNIDSQIYDAAHDSIQKLFKKNVQEAQEQATQDPAPINAPEESFAFGGLTDKQRESYREYIKEAYGVDSYISNKTFGFGLTISDLCPNLTGEENLGTLAGLKKTLEESPYISTPWKVIKGKGGAKTNMTLDSNAYWEVIIEPLCDKELNGGWSFLPHIHEINRENKVEHNTNTYYDKWIPLSNIELQKSKITSKTLGLFDGEFSYPISVEYTNELRMTVIDDQFKSWRRYFQRVADVSVYSSEAHDEAWYKKRNEEGGDLTVRPTAIDKSKFCAAYYKNITFRIRLYFMTPQYSTIKKFDLLCVMKDFSEEYYGEVEGGGQDLNISFSIVGENKNENTIRYSIDENGIGAWQGRNGEKFVSLGADVSVEMKHSDDARTAAENKAADEHKATNGKKRKKTKPTDTPADVTPPEEAPVGITNSIVDFIKSIFKKKGE